jgi:hypothetical protein
MSRSRPSIRRRRRSSTTASSAGKSDITRPSTIPASTSPVTGVAAS